MSQVISGSNAPVDQSTDPIDWNIRPFRDADLPGLVDLANTVYDTYKVPLHTTRESLHARITGPHSDPSRQFLVADAPRLPGVPAGMPVGSANFQYEEDIEAGERMYFINLRVHPEAEGMGLEQALVERLADLIHATQADPEMKPLPKATVKAWSFEQLLNLRSLYARFGLREVRQFWTMARPLNNPIDEPDVIEGITIRPFKFPQDNEGARHAFDASFADHWDHHPTPPDEWEHWLKMPQMRTDLSVLAEIDAEPGTFAGFCMIEINNAVNEHLGVSEGWIELLGTIRGWRRMGLGRAILLHGLHSLRIAGMDTAILGVDSESPTGANRLYESVGFRIRSREFSYACGLEEFLP